MIRTATTYQEYLDIQGNNDSDTLANMGDNLPMELPPPKTHDIILHGHIMKVIEELPCHLEDDATDGEWHSDFAQRSKVLQVPQVHDQECSTFRSALCKSPVPCKL